MIMALMNILQMYSCISLIYNFFDIQNHIPNHLLWFLLVFLHDLQINMSETELMNLVNDTIILDRNILTIYTTFLPLTISTFNYQICTQIL